MGRLALTTPNTSSCLLLLSPSRPRRDPPARPSRRPSLPATRSILPRLVSASTLPSRSWLLPRRWFLPLLLVRRELAPSSFPPRSPRPRSPRLRSPRPRSLPPRRPRSQRPPRSLLPRRPRSLLPRSLLPRRLPRSPLPRRLPRSKYFKHHLTSHSSLSQGYHNTYISYTTLSDLRTNYVE